MFYLGSGSGGARVGLDPPKNKAERTLQIFSNIPNKLWQWCHECAGISRIRSEEMFGAVSSLSWECHGSLFLEFRSQGTETYLTIHLCVLLDTVGCLDISFPPF